MKSPLPCSFRRLVAGLFVTAALTRALADVTPGSLFCDHAVLQQGAPLPVWGTADDGEKVTVEFAGQKAATVAKAGHWLVKLAPVPAGGPYSLVITGHNRVVLSDVLVGEVWLCGGQSNMERHLGLQPGQKPIIGWEAAVASADLPQIRHFGVQRNSSLTPLEKVQGQWRVCSPETVADFTAVGFFFGRALAHARGVPIGLIHSSWGGTPAEAWMSGAALNAQPAFATILADQEQVRRDPAAANALFASRMAGWYQKNDPGTAATPMYSDPARDHTAWKTMDLPVYWEKAGVGMDDFDGIVWFRKEFDLPASWNGQNAELHLGAVDDADTTWVNGQQIGATTGWDTLRVYPVPAKLLHPGRNVIAVRVLDTGGNGGIWGNNETLRLVNLDQPEHPAVSLNGPWHYQATVEYAKVPTPPATPTPTGISAGALYNAMIAPLEPYALKGVIWYQGESNSSQTRLYRSLFPALIADWRQAWGTPNLPFLFVQIAPFSGMPPEIREAQLLTLQHTANTAMAVTIDVGDEKDIHPANKVPVGERLALAARALAYGENLEFSGPLFEAATFEAGHATVRFSHVGGGLVAPGGELLGFTLAGADKVFHPAKAVIKGGTVEVTAEGVAAPVAVRFGWANVPVGNLFNRAGLPASPFRSDVD